MDGAIAEETVIEENVQMENCDIVEEIKQHKISKILNIVSNVRREVAQEILSRALINVRNTEKEKDFFSIREASIVLGRTYLAVYRAMKRGVFSGVKRKENGEYTIPCSEVLRVIETQKAKNSVTEVADA